PAEPTSRRGRTASEAEGNRDREEVIFAEDKVSRKASAKRKEKGKTSSATPVEEEEEMMVVRAIAIETEAMAREWVGAHVSAAGGVHNCVHNALRIGANAFALFLRSPRRWAAPELEEDVVEAFFKQCSDHGFDHRHVLPHGNYLINLSSQNEETRRSSLEALLEDVRRCDRLGIRLYNFHPGSAAGVGRSAAIAHVANGINKALAATTQVTVLVENMAGQGAVLGRS
ncbi:unnamed protein product, partial [Phaeothamnion confervicola]